MSAADRAALLRAAGLTVREAGGDARLAARNERAPEPWPRGAMRCVCVLPVRTAWKP